MKVFINPGHSENCKPDPGATSGDNKEALIARQIGDELATILKSNNIEVELYQQRNEKNENLTSNQQLNRVPKIANESKADIFISIHLNAGSSAAHGTETLYAKNSKNGEKLATLINSSLTKPFTSYSLTNRGAKADVRNLLVLRTSKMPAVLVEVGFISNLAEVNFIKANIHKIAERIADGIFQYFNINAINQLVATETVKSKVLLEQVTSNLYNCYVNDSLKLKRNKLDTCLDWIKKNV